MKYYPILGLLTLSGFSQAAIVVSKNNVAATSSTLNHGYSPSSTDLIHGQAPSASSGLFNFDNTAGPGVLTDGLFPSISRGDSYQNSTNTGVLGTHTGAAFDKTIFAAAGAVGGTGTTSIGTSLTYSFGTAVNISNIDVYGGWQDGGRNQQKYRIYYTTTLSPIFTELAGGEYVTGTGVDYNPGSNQVPLSGNSGGLPSATRVSISDSAGNLIENVTAVRFDFASNTENAWTGYAEIDIIGSVIPEPSSAALLGIGLLGALRRRR